MSDQSTPRPASQPPPLPAEKPPASLSYATPASQPQAAGGDPGAQRVFDTVTGPNLRLMDNLVQLACVVVGGAAGIAVARVTTDQSAGSAFLVVGGIIGVVCGLVLSGAVIGIVRGRNALRRK